MSEVGVEIIKTEESKKSGIKYLNINVSNSEVERNPDIVRLCADAGILEYVKPKTGRWIRWYEQKGNDCVVDNIPHCKCSECGKEYDPHSSQFIKYCNECGAKMVEPQESESKRCMELAKLYLQGLRAGLAEGRMKNETRNTFRGRKGSF